MDSIDVTASFFSQIADAADTVSELITDSREEYKELHIIFENAIHSLAIGECHVAFQHLYKLQFSIDVINLKVYTNAKTSSSLPHSDKLTTDALEKTTGCTAALEKTILGAIENNDACPIAEINNSNNDGDNSNMEESESTSTHVTENNPKSKKVMFKKKRGRGTVSRKGKKGKKYSKTQMKTRINTTKVNDTNLPMDNIVLSNDLETDFDDESVEELITIKNKISDEDERILISHYYRIVFQAPPPRVWGGYDGTFALIRKALNFKLNKLSKIKKIVGETYKSSENDGRCDSTYIIRGGKERIIQQGSSEESDIADFLEDGVSLRDVTRIFNERSILQDCGGILENSHWFTKRSAIEGAFNRMKKIEVPMKKRAQGSEDKTCNWAKARHRFITQMQVCMGDEPDLSKFKNENGDVPDYFILENLIPIDFNGTAFWGEAHRQCLVGDGRNKDSTQFKFARNENGEYDECGEVSDETAAYCTFKFNKEVRLALGCAQKMIRNEHGEMELFGGRLHPYDYSGKTILTIKDFDEHINKEIRRVKALKGVSKFWSNVVRENKLYLLEDVIELTSVGNARAVLLRDIGLRRVIDFVALPQNDETMILLRQIKGVNQKMIDRWIVECSIALPGHPPETVDHSTAENPYESKYGALWKNGVKKSSSMSPYVCITEMVQHIVDETARFYKNTPFENSWRFYHDSLSLLTAKDTISWMKNKGYYDRWIHPQLGVNAEFARYRDNPPGNSPEMMPMDVSLNKDIHKCVTRHCSVSRALLKRIERDTDHRAFSLSTPKEGSRSYHRLYHPETGIAPTSKQIIQDIEGVYVAMVKICEAEGAFVHGLAERSGKRYISDTTGKKSGGTRVRGNVHPLSVDILHTDLRELYDDANWCR